MCSKPNLFVTPYIVLKKYSLCGFFAISKYNNKTDQPVTEREPKSSFSECGDCLGLMVSYIMPTHNKCSSLPWT